MKFSFLLLTWNRSKFLELCLRGLFSSIRDRDACEIIVMDNGSTDGTRALLESMAGEKGLRTILRAKNHGLESYRKLFREAKGEYVIVVDDDVLEFPYALDDIFLEYMKLFPDYGYLALNVVQNEHTNGAKPSPEAYTEESREGRTLQLGPTGGWCSCFRRSEYRKLWLRLLFATFDMKTSEDGFLAGNFRKVLGLKSGIIRDHVCFHAAGPYYAAQYGHLDREIAKYKLSGMSEIVNMYEQFRPAESSTAGSADSSHGK